MEVFCYKIRFILFNGSWWSKSLPSLRSKAKFDRTNGHIGSEMPQVELSTSSQES